MSDTKKAVTAVDKATKGLTKVVTDVTKVMGDLSALASVSESLAFDIESKQNRIEEIEVQNKEAERAAKADLNVRIIENEDRVLDGLLSSRGLARIPKSALSALESDLLDANLDVAEQVNAAVAQAEKNAAIAANASKSHLQSAHDVETATLKADKIALEAKVSFLESNVNDLRSMIAAEREARVSMSENASQPTINVSSAK